MKRITFTLLILLSNLVFFSCSDDFDAENSLYETQSTVGEDGHVNEDPDA